MTYSTFSPRPEAHPMKWKELMKPVQEAVSDLLFRIDGAQQTQERLNKTGSNKQEFGNCFLVYGSRGTGKTTVLLSAKEAICSNSDFSTIPDNNQEGKDETRLKECEKKLPSNLKNIIWLDVLDLEPLPAKANLLATLLTRVRNALDKTGCWNRSAQLTSILEEDTDSARQQLNRLIKDATMMWEDIQEADTRSIANRQVAAADIYAEFRDRFRDAMDKLSQELGRYHGQDDKGCSIVLPIDNIDRSTDHLQAIVKLAQMVSHSRLWLVMAGDRVEVEKFLERAYWKELIHSQDGADARGKTGAGGEDEALVMARRQASATSQKLWPTTHRVEVHLMSPEETLEFPPGDMKKGKKIRELLYEVIIPTSEEQRNCSLDSTNNCIHMIDLFELPEKWTQCPPTDKRLTRAAHHGLSLPARSVLDLWQLAHWAVNDSSACSKKNFKAEKIARTMLRNAIAGSKMASATGQRLQDEIIRRSEDEGTILYFANIAPQLLEMIMSLYTHKSCIEDSKTNYVARSKLKINSIEDVILALEREHPSRSYAPSYEYNAPSTHNFPQPFVIATEGEEQNTELPPLVAAWLSVLFDILILAEQEIGSSVINNELKYSSDLVQTYHEILKKTGNHGVIQAPLSWPIPKWGAFFAYDIFWQHWRLFRKNLLPILERHPQSKIFENISPRLLVAGWVLKILETFKKIVPLDSDSEANNCISKLSESEKSVIEECSNQKSENNNESSEQNIKMTVMTFENEVFKAAATFYSEIKLTPTKNDSLHHRDLKEAMINWLENELPYLMSYLFVPVKESRCEKLVAAIEELSSEQNLAMYWKDNCFFILHDFQEMLLSLIPEEHSINHQYGIESFDIEKTKNEILRDLMEGPFGDLARALDATTVKYFQMNSLYAHS